MSDKPRPQGYIDNALLARAVKNCRVVVAEFKEIAEAAEHGRLTTPLFQQSMQRAGLHLADMRDALAGMEHIRRGRKKKP